MGFGQSLKPGVGVGMKIEFVSLKAVLHDGVGVPVPRQPEQLQRELLQANQV